MTYQTIKTPAGETLIVLPLADFEALQYAAEARDHAATMAGIAAGTIETVSAEDALAFASAATPLAFWREKRGLTQKALADRVGISQSYLAELAAGKRKGDPALFKRLAEALGVSMEMLVAD